MVLPFVSGRLTRGGSFAAGPAAPVTGVSYDEDAQTYFTALEGATGWSAPADYDDKKLAISNYFEALKADSNFTDVKAMYLPIWQAAGPNAMNAVNPGTYDLSWVATVTHTSGDYIYSDGISGLAKAGFQAYNGTGSNKFFGINDFCFGANMLSAAAASGWVVGNKYQPMAEFRCGW